MQLMSLPKSLTPDSPQLVMKLLRENFDFDVSDWSNWLEGEKNPQSNPRYCYEWAFQDRRAGVVLNLWRKGMIQMQDGAIEHHLTLAADQKNEANGTRKGRRKRMMQLLALVAAEESIRLRVLVLDDLPPSGRRKNPLRVRGADSEDWWIKSYDSEGTIVLRRGERDIEVVDQYDLPTKPPAPPQQVDAKGKVYVRDPNVRHAALTLAKGRCQYCNKLGFRLDRKRVYLESHHVIPLAHNGPDHVSNVVGLCPNHHREVHYGASSGEITEALLTVLETLHGSRPTPLPRADSLLAASIDGAVGSQRGAGDGLAL